jgi:hypothetical protein
LPIKDFLDFLNEFYQGIRGCILVTRARVQPFLLVYVNGNSKGDDMAKDDIVKRVYRDLKFSSEKMQKLRKAITEDFKFYSGKQWEESDMEELRKAGVLPLTINKIKPIVRLLTGIERQSKSDFKAFPEGAEDSITAEIASRLIKNVVKNSSLEMRLSEQFKNGSVGGLCFIEPYIDYTFDLVNGEMKFKKVSPLDVFIDPHFKEYDLSDARYIIKVKLGLTLDEVTALFPDKESKLKNMGSTRIDFEEVRATSVAHIQREDYPPLSEGKPYATERDYDEVLYDLIDYYYKKITKKYYVVVAEGDQVIEFDTEEEANQAAAKVGSDFVIEREVPVITLVQVIGDKVMYEGVAYSYPRYKSYPLIPYFADLTTEDLSDLSLQIQGIVRGIKDLNLEYNKRRTQELRHLNSSANSGFDIEEDQLEPEEESKLKKFGSTPGVVIKRRRNTPPLVRLQPMPLSQGHAQLAAENAQDLKEASGVNPDLLANESQSQSGRAILLKQRQGLAMIQEMLDNFSVTKKMTGRFILTQLPEIFTLENAKRVLGSAFIHDNFNVPVNVILDRALGKVEQGREAEVTDLEREVMLTYPNISKGQPIQDETGDLVTALDTDVANQVIMSVLSDDKLAKYDIAIGEGPYQDTIQMANFMDLKELAQQGVPIPPAALISQSMLPESQKKQIMKQLQAQAAAMQQGGQQ